MTDLFDIVIRFRIEIAGALIMASIGAWLIGLNNRRNRTAAAAANFRNIILTELKGLYPIPADWPTDIYGIDRVLKNAFPRLQAAVIEFRPFVPVYKRHGFDRAWRIYRLGKDKEIDKQSYDQYMPFKGEAFSYGEKISEHDNTKTYKETFRKNVDNLLKYAKQI